MSFTLTGKYNEAKVFTDMADDRCVGQLINLLNQPFTAGSKIRIMPDCHAGSGCVIGTTMTIHDALVPNLVGVDIGCGMMGARLEQKDADLEKLDTVINACIPTNGAYDEPLVDFPELEELRCKKLKLDLAKKSLGTLGGGNHFIELDRDSQGNLWLVVHTGSRHLGMEICDYYQKQGYLARKFEKNGGNRETKTKALIQKLKEEGNARMISQAIKQFDKTYVEAEPDIPAELCYCSGELLEDYLHDMEITQKFAALNRMVIVERIMDAMGWSGSKLLDTIHNYIDIPNRILRKGSVSAQKGEELLIPLNMRDGTLLCVGKGNPDWNCSAPHGAGRLYSRSQARELFETDLSLDDFRETMKDVYSSSVCQSTVDESPWAYKPAEAIIDNIGDTVEIIDQIKPIYNFKAH